MLLFMMPPSLLNVPQRERKTVICQNDWPLCLSAISSEVFFVTFLAQVHDGLRARLLQPLVCGACPAKKESFSLGVGKETKILLPLCLPILSSQGFPGAIRCSRVE